MKEAIKQVQDKMINENKLKEICILLISRKDDLEICEDLIKVKYILKKQAK